MIHGTEGEQFSVYSEQRHPYGTLMCLPDGRRYRFAEIGATNIVAGALCQAEVPGANFDELAVPAAVAQEATTLGITNGSTAINADDFNEGYVNVEDDIGEGHLYKIKDTPAVGSTNLASIEIERGKWQDDPSAGDPNSKHGIVVAWTTATTVGLTKNPFKDVIIHPSPNTAVLTGVTPRALAANKFGWLQVGGPASVITQGTLAIGLSCQPSSSADGAVAPFTLTEGTPNTEITPVCGNVMEVAATTEESLVNLRVAGW
jgi:hypothetical protein